MSEPMQLAQVPGAPLLPQVNLLPPSVLARRKVAAVRLWLALVVVVVMLLTSIAALDSRWQQQSAESDLVEIQDRNDALLKKQTAYSEVPQVLRDVAALKTARAVAMSTEMLWSPYLAAIASATPLEASIDALSVAQDTVFSGAQSQLNGPLSTPGTVGQVSLNGRALSVDTVSDWEENLMSLTGVTDVEVSSVEVTDDNGTVYYAVGATFRLTPDAFANRFVVEQ